MARAAGRLAAILGIAALGLCPRATLAARPAYPETAVRPVADTLHRRVVVDPYRWLEDAGNSEVQEWIARQNAFTRDHLDSFGARPLLTRRLAELFALPVLGSPRVRGERLFYSRRAESDAQPVYLMRDGRGGARVALDPNTLSADGGVAVDWLYPSPDGRLIAYGTSSHGSEQSTLAIRDVESGRDLPDRIPRTQFASLAWDRDGRGFHYSRHPEPGTVPAGEEVFHKRIFHHRLGDDPARDSLVHGGEGAAIQEQRAVYASSDFDWLFLRTSLDWARNALYLKRAGSPVPFAPVAVGLRGTADGDVHRGRLYLRTNVGAPRYRIVAADPAHPESANWKDVIPEQAGVIKEFHLAGDRIVVSVSESAVSRILLFDLRGAPAGEIALPALGTVSSLTGDGEGRELFFVFTSFGIPQTVYRFDLASGGLEPLDPGAGPLPLALEIRRERVTSADGTQVPIFVVHRAGLELDGNRPTILYGYGGFNNSMSPSFSPAPIPWLEAGGVWVQACLRGGGEFGSEWHQAGRLERKQNVFDDYHAVAAWLVERGITRPERLAARGGSNGGLLVGAALTQKPELFGAVVCQVPLLDMIRYHRFSIARYWIPEYGSAEDSTQFDFIHAYSPYHHVREGVRYPATLLTASEADARVAPLHAMKMAALLQARTAGDAPILLRFEHQAGHGAGKPTGRRIEEAVDVLSFLMLRFGVTPG